LLYRRRRMGRVVHRPPRQVAISQSRRHLSDAANCPQHRQLD
jgi:hypothetical protein